MLHATWYSGKPRATLRKTHASLTPRRPGILFVFNCAGLSSCSPIIFLRTRLASRARGCCQRHSRLALGQFSSWNVFDLGGAGFTTRRLRPRLTDGPHDPALAAHDVCSRVDPVG